MANAISQDVIEKIIQQAAEEAALICNFTRDIDWLKNELRIISGGLNHANSLLTKDDDVKEWLHHAWDVACDAEDIVEECVVYNRDELFFRDKMAEKIQEVKERSRFITKYGTQLKLFRDLVPSTSEQPSSSPVWKENSLLSRDSHPVAIEPKIQHLISLLDESSVPVIAVVGIGGAGKTFLLQNLFDRIKHRYEHSIWLSVSQSYSVHKLQCDLASHMGYLKDAVKDVSEKRAKELIHAALQRTKSFIVLDDVPDDNIIASLGLPIGHDSQCKVVVTTRNRGIGQNLGARIYEMGLLSEEESWELFCAYAFSNYDRNLPPQNLKVVAGEVEKQCGRLPLALKTIAASLSGCTESSEWNSKLSRLKEWEQKEVTTPDYRIIEILRLSYDSLPSLLKPCFSYLSVFSEVERIDCEYLINLWIVEGFIPQGEDQWDVAWGYLYQLVNLCLLEVWEDWGLIKYCKIHDLLLDLAIDVSKENRFSFAVDDVTSVKRILLAKKEIDDMVMAHNRASCHRSLRTLLLYKNLIEKIEVNFFSPMRLLRVLDLSKSNISTLPDFVGKLKLLRLLNLSSTKIKEIPICVRGLKSLVFLDLCHCQQLQTLPEWINELRCLQHLKIKNCNDELRSHMPKGISELVSLRVLRSDALSLSVEEDGLLKLEDVVKLNHLQELSLEVKHEKELEIIKGGILAQLLRMRYLSIESHFSTESHLPHNITALQDLQTLCLGKYAVPSWVCMLLNLRQLKLCNCDCIDYPALEAMPNLIELRLEGNKSCRKLPRAFGKSSGFPKLRFLIISDFPLLEELPDLEDGAMAVLEKFYLVRCPRVKEVPEGLKGLRRLLDFYCGMKGTDAHLSQPSQKEDIAGLSTFSSPPQPSQQQTIAGSSTNMETDFMNLLKKFDGISQVNDLIQYIEKLLKNMSGEKSEIIPRSPCIEDGQVFMEIIEKHIVGFDKKELTNSVIAEMEIEVVDVFKGVGKIRCVGAALSMVGFALEISSQMSRRYQECFELLKDMFDLGKNILCLNDQMPEHKQMLNEALKSIVVGCIICVSQSRTNIFRYLTAAVNAESLQDFRHKIYLLNAKLQLLPIIDIERRQPKIPSPSQEFYTFMEYKHQSDKLSLQKKKHRIFLVCYELDCIRTMVDKLFKSLNAGGVTVIVIEFLYWEIAVKEDFSLKQVSEGTDIHIPIFSKENYLRHLEQWLCSCRPNSIIRPLFYDTNEDIKCQFDKTLNKLAHTQDCTAGVFSYSNAPLQASFFPGWSLLDYKTEQRLVKRVVFDILEMLNNLPLPLPLHAVGLEERMEDLIAELKMELDRTKMVVAICGMAGIGKTTVAKAIFNSIGPRFQARSFIAPVKAKELCKLQEQILKDLARQDILVKSVDHGKALMKAHLRSIRALVILDDIDHSRQLEAFNVDCLAPGSRLILTSRDTELLAFAHADKIYDIAQFGLEESVELFSWHAFLRTDPDDGYEDRSRKIAKSCQGIPLLLEVAGASLYDRAETNYWDESIRHLESTIDQSIHRRLCVSTQGLESHEIEIFLDIICFSVAKENLETALRFWKAIGRAANRALEKLIQNSLVRIDDKKQFIIHDLLHDMGRAMVADNSLDFGECRRFWRPQDAQVITKSLGTMSVQGFSIAGEETDKIFFQAESFAPMAMTNLQLLWIAGEVEKTDFLNSCPGLRWLRWNSPPLTCLPSEWSVEHLTILDLSSVIRESPGELRELWSDKSLSKEFENLNVLRLSSAQYLERLPDFSVFPALTALDLQDCPNLTSIPDSIGILGGLKCLNLSWCRNLVKLPDGISKLSSLEKLSLSRCFSLKELPSAVEELVALKELDIGFARHIEELPSFSKLVKLEILTLAGCLSIRFLPESIGELKKLRELDIQLLGLIQKLPSLGKLVCLKKLILSGCESLRNLPESVGELRCLQYLEMNKCSSIDCLPEEFGDLVHLEELYMNDCPRFLNFPSRFKNLVNLTILELKHNPNLMQLPSSFSNLPLVWFDASNCNLLEGLHEGIGDILPLGILNLENNFFCQLPASICKLTNLTKLNLNNCQSLEELPAVPEGIVELDIGSCKQLIRLPSMSDLKRLTTLILCNCEKLLGLPELGSCQCLAVLNITNCIYIRNLAGVGGLNSLKTFYFGGSGVSVSNLNQHIEDMPQLEEVCIHANGIPHWVELKTGDHCLKDDNFTDVLHYSVKKNAKCGGLFLFFVVNFMHEYYTPGFPSENSMELAIIADNQESILVTIFSNRQNVEGDQLYICMYGETHLLVRRMEVSDSISVKAKGRNIQIRECGMQLLYNGTRDANFQRMVKDLSLLADSYTSKTSEDEVDALDDIEDKARDEEELDGDLYDYGYASSEGEYQAEEDCARY